MSRHQAVQIMCRNGGWYVCYFTVFWWAGIKPFKWCVEMVVGMFAISVFWWAGIKPFKWCVEMVVGMFAISQCFDELASSRSNDVSKWWLVCLLFHSVLMSRHQAVQMMCRNGGRYVCYFTVFRWAGIKPFKLCVEMVVGMFAISQCFDELASSRSNDVSKWWLVCLLFQCFDEQASSRSNDVSKWWLVCLLFHSVLMSWHQAVQMMCRNGGRYVCYFTVFWWAGIKPFKWCVEMVVGMFAISQCFDELASSRSNDVS